MSKILVTGATGHFGKETIKHLLEKGVRPDQISALVRNKEKADELKAKGVNVVLGDYNDYASLVQAFAGVDKLLFVSSNDVMGRLSQHEQVVKAAKEVGVKHVAYTSSIHRNMTDSAIAVVNDAHIKTEKWLVESGLPVTILNNALYLDVIPMYVGDTVLDTGIVYFPAKDGKVAAALRSDMAEAAAVVLSTDGHESKSYELSNVESYSFQDIADGLSEVSGKPIQYVSPEPAEYSQALAARGVPAEYIGFFTGFGIAQAKGEFDVAGHDLEKLLGRKPASLKDFLNGFYANG